MSNDRLEPFNYHNIAFKRCMDDVSLGRLDRLWFFRHHWFVKIGWLEKMRFKAQTCWTELSAFWGVWNRSRILIFGPDQLFSDFLEPCIKPFTVPIANMEMSPRTGIHPLHQSHNPLGPTKFSQSPPDDHPRHSIKHLLQVCENHVVSCWQLDTAWQERLWLLCLCLRQSQTGNHRLTPTVWGGCLQSSPGLSQSALSAWDHGSCPCPMHPPYPWGGRQ